MIKISPSILACDMADLKNQAKLVEDGGAEYLHVDVMDGHFVPNLSFGIGTVASLRPHTGMVLDVHLMIENPEKYIADFAKAGSDIITIHVEATNHIHRAMQQIRDNGCKVGLALNPGTPASAIKEVGHLADMILVMSVNPGFTAQKFIPDVLGKVREIRAMYPDKDIQIDGGIGAGNIYTVTEAGANVIVAGAAVFYEEDKAAAIKNLKDKAYKG